MYQNQVSLQPSRSSQNLRFESIFLTYRPQVAQFLRRFGVRGADLEDLCQEVFLTVFRSLRDFEGRSALRTWIFGIARNTALAHHRRARRRGVEVLMAEVPDREGEHCPVASCERSAASRALAHALGRLDDRRRRIIVLHDLQEQPMRQVAATLACPLPTAFTRLYAARRYLRDLLDPALCDFQTASSAERLAS